MRLTRTQRRGSSLILRNLLLSLFLGAMCVSCTPEFYHKTADRETFGILYQKAPYVENVTEESVDIEPPEPVNLSKLHSEISGAEFLGNMAHYERGAKVLSLSESLDTAIHHARDYLTEKERIYLSALDLTLARYELAPIFSGSGNGLWRSDKRTAQIQQGMNQLVATNTFARTQSVGFSKLHRTGALITADFTQDFLRFITGDRSVNDSALAVRIAQPLLQGGGTKVTLEALTQEERNVLYDLRDFANFRRNFIVGVVSDYYSVLQARDRVQNNWLAYQGFLTNVEREEALAEEDRRTQTELGQLRQAALQSESRWVDSVRDYETRLDQFKVDIGVPVSEKIILLDSELKRLKIEDPELSREQAVEVALVTRPDLATACDQVDDAARRIDVAKNGLLPGLDIDVQYDVVSDPRDTTPGLNFNRRSWSSSVDLDLPLDRKSERNIYRARLIFLERAKRAEDLARENVRLQIFNDWRTIEQARRNFEISDQGVELSARRLEEQRLLADLGRGEARDLVDAQNDLVNAQNQRTSTLVDHTLARLRLWRDMGILYIESDGSWVTKLAQESP